MCHPPATNASGAQTPASHASYSSYSSYGSGVSTPLTNVSSVYGGITKADASRIQSSQMCNGHDVGTGSFAARAQSAADRAAGGGKGAGRK